MWRSRAMTSRCRCCARMGHAGGIHRRASGFAAVFAEVLAQSAQRAAGLTLAALEAARVDEDIAAVAAQLVTQRQVMATWLVDGLLRRSPLREARSVSPRSTPSGH